VGVSDKDAKFDTVWTTQNL